MFDKYLNITDASKADPEHIEEAYNLLKEYCTEKNENILTFIKDKNNIKYAAEYIHKNLNFAYRMILKKEKIEKLIIENLPFIQEKTKELHEKEFGKTTISAKVTKKTKKIKEKL